MTENSTNLSQKSLGVDEDAQGERDSQDDVYAYDDEEDADEAEEIARRLGDQLWADISKAQADRGVATPSQEPHPTATETNVSALSALDSHTGELLDKKKAAIVTMKAILSSTDSDPLARSYLAATIVPGTNGESVLEALHRTVACQTISKELAKNLSDVLVSLARSEALFSGLRNSDLPSIHLDSRKRKRDRTDEGWHEGDPRSLKRSSPSHDLQRQIKEAVHVITGALGSSSSGGPLETSTITAIQPQLHQVFLFAVTSSAGGGPFMNALQEISGLIQVVAVLSGVRIGPTPDSEPMGIDQVSRRGDRQPTSGDPEPATTNSASFPQLTDIGTAVYPCLFPACGKIFSRLYGLRSHQRVHAAHRPFACNSCPASFARNHDLKRHEKLHQNKAWRCGGCSKVFSRRDAIKRHKNSSRVRGGDADICVHAEVAEIELGNDGGEEAVREGRRVKMWYGLTGHQNPNVTATRGLLMHGDDLNSEEGEIPPPVIAEMQSTVTSLHGLLQAHVAGALGTSRERIPSQQIDPTVGQATLASVIARAQLQQEQLSSSMGGMSEQVSDLVSVAASQPSMPPNSSGSMGVTEGKSAPSGPTLSLYGLSDEQANMLEQAIAKAASAAQAQAEAEAALEEELDEYEEDDDGDDSGRLAHMNS